jgi:prevent-host-death family protein
MQVNMHEAKTKLSQLVDAALSGEAVTIARAGRPVAKLVPLDEADEQPIFGALSGWDIDWEAFEQSDGDIQEAFENSAASDVSPK